MLFDGEIWLLGGRNVQVSEVAAVEIFDPVSKTWRNGPSLTESRSGFGAAVVQGQIMVAGGELISGGNLGLTLDSFEVYAPSRGQFVRGPDMPAPLHGVALVSIDDKLLVLGGANVAGSIAPAGQYFLYEPAIAKQD